MRCSTRHGCLARRPRSCRRCWKRRSGPSSAARWWSSCPTSSAPRAGSGRSRCSLGVTRCSRCASMTRRNGRCRTLGCWSWPTPRAVSRWRWTPAIAGSASGSATAVMARESRSGGLVPEGGCRVTAGGHGRRPGARHRAPGESQGPPGTRRVMTFLWPWMLLLLLGVPLLVFGYLGIERRRVHATGRYRPGSCRGPRRRIEGHATLLADVRRYAPATILLAGIVMLIVALARPQAVVAIPREEGIVVLVFDVSGSMAATDGGRTGCRRRRHPARVAHRGRHPDRRGQGDRHGIRGAAALRAWSSVSSRSATADCPSRCPPTTSRPCSPPSIDSSRSGAPRSRRASPPR